MQDAKLSELVREFVDLYYDEKIKESKKVEKKILRVSKAWNKESVVEDIKNRIDQYRMYEDESKFPFEFYIIKLNREMET